MKNAYVVLLKGISVRVVEMLEQGVFVQVNTINLKRLQNDKFQKNSEGIISCYLNKCAQGPPLYPHTNTTVPLLSRGIRRETLYRCYANETRWDFGAILIFESIFSESQFPNPDDLENPALLRN